MLEVFGWDVGGAHVKVSRSLGGRLQDVVQWPCPLWQGMGELQQVLAQARQRWPQLQAAQGLHAVTMTGEMVDHFSHREAGVQAIATALAAALAPARVRLFAGEGTSTGWCGPSEAAALWPHIASANWLATARHLAWCSPQAQAGARAEASGLLVDIGSTSTDLIAWRGGQVLTRARSDAERLASGELVYQGVVRTPLCALGPRIAWRDLNFNVMNEFFATTADVYRLTGELDPAHDMHPPADGAGKDLPATRQRLARMVGLDARDAADSEWLAMAQAWRTSQLAELAGQMQRVLALHGLGADTAVVHAGCGGFLAQALALACGLQPAKPYAQVVRQDSTGLADWVQVCAPCIAVAALLAREEG